MLSGRLSNGALLCAMGLVVGLTICPIASAETILEINQAGGLLVGDKLFSDFDVTSVGNTAILPDASTIAVTGISHDGDYGIRFNGGRGLQDRTSGSIPRSPATCLSSVAM